MLNGISLRAAVIEAIPTLKYRRLRSDMIEVFKITHNIYNKIQQYHLIFLSMKNLTPEATAINCKINLFIMTYESIFFSARIVNIWNSLPNSVVDACTVNAFKARLDKFWQHQLVKFDFTADLTGTGNRSEEVTKRYCSFMIAYNYDVDLEVSDTCVRNSLLSWVVFWLLCGCYIYRCAGCVQAGTWDSARGLHIERNEQTIQFTELPEPNKTRVITTIQVARPPDVSVAWPTRGKVLSWEYRSPRKRNSRPSSTATILNAHSPQHAFL